MTLDMTPEVQEILNKAYADFGGQIDDLIYAVGLLMVGKALGYDAVRICHSYRYLQKMEKILGVKFKEVLPTRTADSEVIRGVRMADKIGKFWQAVVSGQISADEAKKVDDAR
jgi:hypothetical protein